MTSALRSVACIALLGLVAVACARPGSGAGGSATPLDLYGANPSVAEVQSLLGDSSWWPGPPSFGVRPLDVTSVPVAQKFHVTTRFAHIGTAEMLEIEYALWNSASAATTSLTSIQTGFGTSATGPKVGDQVLYYGQRTQGAAPFGTLTFVRIGASITTIILTQKDAFPTVTKLGKIASKVTSRLRDVLNGKVHASPLPTSDAAMLPPPGPDLTLLGSTKLPVEAFIVMSGSASPDALAGILHAAGADTIVFGDYALDNDTRMEVRAGLFNFGSSQQASGWIDALRGSSIPDQQGIATFYDNGSGQYFSLFTAGTRAAMLVCRSAAAGEAASRACESPLSRVAPAWQLSLTG